MYLPIDCQVAASCIDPKFAPIASILHEVQNRGREAFYDNKIETAFDIRTSLREKFNVKSKINCITVGLSNSLRQEI